MSLKNACIGMAALLGSACSFSQSSVTLQGVVDASLTRVQGDGFGSRTGLASGSNTASRLVFRGTEDLGGGLAASFWLEGQLGVDTGTVAGLNFQRRSTLSLSGYWGELRLGRDYSPTYSNQSAFDVFGNRGVGGSSAYNNFSGTTGATATAIDTVRNNNSIAYFTPADLGGFYGTAQYAFGGQPAGEPQSTDVNDKAGRYAGGRVGYAAGPLNIAAAYGRYQQVGNAASVTAARGNLDVANIGGSYDLGVVKPFLLYGQERLTGFNSATLTSAQLGLTAPIGAGEVRASYGHYDLKGSANDFNKLAIGYGYNFSKRTQFYVTIATLRNKGASARSLAADGVAATGVRPGGNSNGVDIGLRHLF